MFKLKPSDYYIGRLFILVIIMTIFTVYSVALVPLTQSGASFIVTQLSVIAFLTSKVYFKKSYCASICLFIILLLDRLIGLRLLTMISPLQTHMYFIVFSVLYIYYSLKTVLSIRRETKAT